MSAASTTSTTIPFSIPVSIPISISIPIPIPITTWKSEPPPPYSSCTLPPQDGIDGRAQRRAALPAQIDHPRRRHCPGQLPPFITANTPADSLLSLAYIRSVLIRLEDTICFLLIERAQFAHNPTMYKALLAPVLSTAAVEHIAETPTPSDLAAQSASWPSPMGALMNLIFGISTRS
ncbi:chorismate mutase aro7, partial [Tilletia horrida]